jgi:hypothetical protein
MAETSTCQRSGNKMNLVVTGQDNKIRWILGPTAPREKKMQKSRKKWQQKKITFNWG